jgi:conjugative relaxase-like TrwC/TraI family protein
MTVHRLHAGDGYTYLTRQVASGDRERGRGEGLADYYTAVGTPPGRWHGRGAAALGVVGVVSEAQMKALFGEGLHPDADALIAAAITAGASSADAVAAVKLGRPFPSFTAAQAPARAELARRLVEFRAEHGRVATAAERNLLRTEAARDVYRQVHGRAPGGVELGALLGAEKRTQAQAVAGYDLVFTPPKSVNLLWGLGSGQVRDAVAAVHERAVTETLEWVQTEAGKTRRGAQGVRQIDTQGLTIARFDHFDNRTGDPNLHTHAAVSNKVLGADGKWSALDGRVLYAVGVAASTRYNALMVDHLRRELGVDFEDRSKGPEKEPVKEIAGIPDAMITDFSRRADIVARTDELTAQYRASHGHSPSKVSQIRLAQQAVLDTRDTKPVPRSLTEMRAEWAGRATAHTGGQVPADWVDDLLASHRDPGRVRSPEVVFDRELIAAAVVETVSRRRATWTEANLRAAAEDRVARCVFDTPEQARAAVEEVVTAARDTGSLLLSIDPDDPTPAVVSRADGTSVYRVHGAARYTSQAVLDAERGLLAAGHTPTTAFLTGAAVDAAVDAVATEGGRELNEGQRAIARHLATSGQLVAVAVGPAGTGKTTAMRALTRAWTDDGHQVVALAPNKAGATVLGDELGVGAQTVAKLLTTEHHRDREGQPSGVAAGTMLLVDEAGMTATADLAALLELARTRGAVLRLVGDPDQLSAVESGGALRLLAADTRAPELAEVVRFADPAEADAGLAVRGGDTDAAWAFYTDHGRVQSGSAEEMREQVLAAHLADTAAGHRSLMMAATVEDVTALNNAAHTARADAGHVDTGGAGVRLRDGLAAYPGDTVVTRRNTPGLRVSGGHHDGATVSNGDLWTVTAVHTGGALTVRGTTHRGTLTLPADYVGEYVELGYATTVHRAQGMTVDTAHTLMAPSLTRSTAYVGLTRGRDTNHLYVVTDTTPEAHPDHQPEESTTPAAVFAAIVARGDDNLAATATLAAELDHTDDTTRLRAIHADLVDALAADRAGYLLDRALPATHLVGAQASPHYRDLVATITAADRHDLDTRQLVTDITTAPLNTAPTDAATTQLAPELVEGPDQVEDTLVGARDPAAVLRSRADAWIAAHTPEQAAVAAGAVRPGGFRALRDLPHRRGLPMTPGRHPGSDTDRADYATTLAARITRLEAAAATGSLPQVVGVVRDRDAAPGRAQVAEQLRTHPVRRRTDHDLNENIRYLREQIRSHRFDRAFADRAAADPRNRTAAVVAAEHAQLPTQVTAITAARAAQERADTAVTAAHAAVQHRNSLVNELATTPGRRALRRRALTEQVNAATEQERTARAVSDAATTAAGVAAAGVGVHPSHWEETLRRAHDEPGLAAELVAAQQQDALRAAGQQRAAAWEDHVRQLLVTAEDERARRGGLTPTEAATEAQVRSATNQDATPPAGATPRWDTGMQHDDLHHQLHDQQRAHDTDLGL